MVVAGSEGFAGLTDTAAAVRSSSCAIECSNLGINAVWGRICAGEGEYMGAAEAGSEGMRKRKSMVDQDFVVVFPSTDLNLWLHNKSHLAPHATHIT